MLGLKSVVSAARYCRCHDELRNFLRCRSRIVNMFLLQRGAGSTCGRQRLPSISSQPPERVITSANSSNPSGAKPDQVHQGGGDRHTEKTRAR